MSAIDGLWALVSKVTLETGRDDGSGGCDGSTTGTCMLVLSCLGGGEMLWVPRRFLFDLWFLGSQWRGASRSGNVLVRPPHRHSFHFLALRS